MYNSNKGSIKKTNLKVDLGVDKVVYSKLLYY
jgi:hypothetical protein